MAYTYGLNVIRRRTSNGRTAFAGVARVFAVTGSSARSILESLELGDALDFIQSDPDITSVQVERQKVTAAVIELKRQKINGQDLGSDTNYQTEFGELLAAQRDLLAAQDARVFLEIY